MPKVTGGKKKWGRSGELSGSDGSIEGREGSGRPICESHPSTSATVSIQGTDIKQMINELFEKERNERKRDERDMYTALLQTMRQEIAQRIPPPPPPLMPHPPSAPPPPPPFLLSAANTLARAPPTTIATTTTTTPTTISQASVMGRKMPDVGEVPTFQGEDPGEGNDPVDDLFLRRIEEKVDKRIQRYIDRVYSYLDEFDIDGQMAEELEMEKMTRLIRGQLPE